MGEKEKGNISNVLSSLSVGRPMCLEKFKPYVYLACEGNRAESTFERVFRGSGLPTLLACPWENGAGRVRSAAKKVAFYATHQAVST